MEDRDRPDGGFREGAESRRSCSPMDPLPGELAAQFPEAIRFALGNPFRRTFLRRLNDHPEQGREPRAILSCPLSACAYHANVLQGCGLVDVQERRPAGRGTYVTLFRSMVATDEAVRGALADTAERDTTTVGR